MNKIFIKEIFQKKKKRKQIKEDRPVDQVQLNQTELNSSRS